MQDWNIIIICLGLYKKKYFTEKQSLDLLDISVFIILDTLPIMFCNLSCRFFCKLSENYKVNWPSAQAGSLMYMVLPTQLKNRNKSGKHVVIEVIARQPH